MFNSFCNVFNIEHDEVNDSKKNHVFVNVYDMIEPNYLTNIGYYAFGVGIFHSAVEINGNEYCFGGHDIPDMTGVFVIEPDSIPELTLKIDMGIMTLRDNEFQEILVNLSKEFIGPSYNLITRNCNHFTEEFVKQLTHRSIPSWINRAARLGNMFPCMVPWDWIQPPDLIEEEQDEHSPLLQHGFSLNSTFQGIVYPEEQ